MALSHPRRFLRCHQRRIFLLVSRRPLRQKHRVPRSRTRRLSFANRTLPQPRVSMLRPSRKQHLQYPQLPSMSPRWPALPCAQKMAAETVSSLSLHLPFTIHSTLPTLLPSHPLIILPVSMCTTPTMLAVGHSRESPCLRAFPHLLRRRIWQCCLHRLRLSQGRSMPHRRPPPRYRWTCRTRRILTQTRSKAPAASKPSGQPSTRAEEKKLRRSNRKPNPNQSNPPAAKATPAGTKKNMLGPKPALDNPNKASNAAKLAHRREKRAWKYAESHPGVEVPRQMTSGPKEKQLKQYQASKK
jgi:hypothetical protein